MEGAEVEQCGSRGRRHHRTDGLAGEEQQRVSDGIKPRIPYLDYRDDFTPEEPVSGEGVSTGLVRLLAPEDLLEGGGKVGDNGDGVRICDLALIHPGDFLPRAHADGAR